MRYIVSADTDVGIKKDTNQDSVCIKVADTLEGQIVMALICDGMGGLSKGELASATVTRAFCDWFDNELPAQVSSLAWQHLSDQWDRLIKELNYKILEYGKQNNVHLGTTLTGILMIHNKYMIVHVGDSRVYKIKDILIQLTEDQTVVGREVRRGNLTWEQAEQDPRRNVLLQCVGESRSVIPDISFGDIEKDAMYMLCSDGFRHVITRDEIVQKLNPLSANSKNIMHMNSKHLIDVIKNRNEKDNISVALIRAMG